MKKTVTILGMSQTSLPGADLIGERGEVWGINSLYNSLPEANYTRWFEIHVADYLRQRKEHWAWLQAQTIPVYMQLAHADVPASIEFPRQALNNFMRNRFDTEADYYTSSFSYMVGLALMEGFEEIHLFGIDLDEDFEYFFERSGLEFMIGLARGSGVKVVVSPHSPILHIGYVYAYTEPRMRLDQVKPALDYLDGMIAREKAKYRQSAIALNDFMEKADALGFHDEAETDLQAHYKALLQIDGGITGMRNARQWLGHYGRGGTLLLPDGTVN